MAQLVPPYGSMNFRSYVRGVIGRLEELRNESIIEGEYLNNQMLAEVLDTCILSEKSNSHANTTLTLCCTPEYSIIARWFFNGEQVDMREWKP